MIPRPWQSLRFRLTATLVAVALVAVTLTSIVAIVGTTRQFARFLEGNRTRREEQIVDRLGNPFAAPNPDLQARTEELGHLYGVLIVIRDDQTGQILAATAPNLINSQWQPGGAFQVAGHIDAGPGRLTVYVGPGGPGRGPGGRYPARPLFAPGVNRETIDALNPDEQNLLGEVNRAFLLSALIAVGVTVLLGLGLAQRIVRPVEALTAASEKMGGGDLNQRVAIETPDEIGALAHAFNQMADNLARLEQLRRNMVSDIAHELRTPLANIRGYLEAVQDGVVQPDAVTIHSLYEETMLLNRIVEDLQEVSLAEAGQLRLDRQAVNITAAVDQAMAALRPEATERGVTLANHVPAGFPAVFADRERLGQILRNLIGNGIRHTPAGASVTVEATTGPMAATIQVQDNGPGIQPEHLPFLFDRFYRVDQSRARSTGGSGLGLAIVKSLVELMGGRVWAESEPGQGARFLFTVSLAEDVEAEKIKA